MVRFDPDVTAIVKRLQQARIELMKTQPFYALLLMHLKFALDDTCETAYTDGERIAFNPDFFNKLDDRELEFVLMHEVLHVVLQHCFRNPGDYVEDTFNTACDIVVNSNIMHSFDDDKQRITLREYGELIHQTPDGREGYKLTVEEVYEILRTDPQLSMSPDQAGSDAKAGGFVGGSKGRRCSPASKAGTGRKEENGPGNGTASGAGQFDDHSFWDGDDESHTQEQLWAGRLINAAEAVKNQYRTETWGSIPEGVLRMINDLTEPKLDWKTILNDFVQEEINDYSFSQLDRRFDDSPFFLPDFAEKEDRVNDILFMIDASGSMTSEMITEVYSEVKGAIDQFSGKLEGWLGFFDAEVVPPISFDSVDALEEIRPYGGGGTSFSCVFDYVRREMQENPPACIIILTDGYALYPNEDEAPEIPVLWIINTEAETAPWGKTVRL